MPWTRQISMKFHLQAVGAAPLALRGFDFMEHQRRKLEEIPAPDADVALTSEEGGHAHMLAKISCALSRGMGT